ncbi:MAG: hypothetical protein ACOC2Y_04205 [Spirochaetota bacterium]
MNTRTIPRPERAVRAVAATAAALVALVALTGCATPFQWEPYPSDGELDALTPDEWRADVEFLRTELPRRNPHFAEDTEMARTFEAEARALDASISEATTPSQMIAGLSELLALVGEGHTSLNSYPTTCFPVVARWFADGFFVAGADSAYSDIVGARVTGIRDASGERLSLAELEVALNSVISVDHPNGYRASQPQVLLDPHLMRGLGLADEGELTYVLEIGAMEIERTVSEMRRADLTMVYASDSAPEKPLAARSSDPNWYARTGEDDRTIYFSYDDCTDEARGLLQDLVDELKRSSVDRLIVDLRANSGGNSAPGTWFASQVAGIPELRGDGGIFVLIGPATFSSGMMLAVDFMEKTDALFAGRPIAESPNSWGEVKRFPLPRSGLMIGHSTKFFRYAEGKNLRLDSDGIIVPDSGFEFRPRFADYVGGVDPVVEAVLAYEP